jgi:hypothetical protein
VAERDYRQPCAVDWGPSTTLHRRRQRR